MSNNPSDISDFARAASEMMMATQTMTLRLLEAEMQALAQMMPPADAGLATQGPTDDEVEQSFENMPV